jgi:hypothetical protein
MKIERIELDSTLIRLSKEELLILNNALNEVCNALDRAEFSTRMGAELEDVEELLCQIGAMIDATREGPPKANESDGP